MNQKRLTLYLLIALAAIVFFYRQYKNSSYNPQVRTAHAILGEMQNKPVYYTRHAKCRMQCRKIDQDEVEEILQKGKINWNKTDTDDQPCATYALEGITRDNQNVRIIYANCNRETKVITTIDLDKEYDCTCP